MKRFIFAFAWLIGSVAASAGTITGLATVIDGDTIDVAGARIRIEGIDAAELGQKCNLASGGKWRCADAAAERLEALTLGKSVECTAHGKDDYGRIIATCHVGGTDLGQRLVDEGLAWAFTKYSNAYVSNEAAAKSASLGVWQSDTITPWDYRAAKWNTAVEDVPVTDCPIKGNISRDGERIYHTPWSPWYSRTKIDTGKGERWFCDEAEAVQAGWRAAKFR